MAMRLPRRRLRAPKAPRDRPGDGMVREAAILMADAATKELTRSWAQSKPSSSRALGDEAGDAGRGGLESFNVPGVNASRVPLRMTRSHRDAPTRGCTHTRACSESAAVMAISSEAPTFAATSKELPTETVTPSISSAWHASERLSTVQTRLCLQQEAEKQWTIIWYGGAGGSWKHGARARATHRDQKHGGGDLLSNAACATVDPAAGATSNPNRWTPRIPRSVATGSNLPLSPDDCYSGVVMHVSVFFLEKGCVTRRLDWPSPQWARRSQDACRSRRDALLRRATHAPVRS